MLTGSCHCGRNAFEVDAELPAELTRCTCSFCSKRGALWAYFESDRVRITLGDSDGIYRWNSRQVGHHFCTACGCTTWSDTPAFGEDGGWDGESRRVSINARLVEGVEAADWPVTVIDGKNQW